VNPNDAKLVPEESKDGKDQREFSIDDLFGKIFGIERVHILQKSDRLQDVLEKISIAPENKLVYVEKQDSVTPSGATFQTAGGNYQILNILTLGDLLTFMCPIQQEDS